VILTVGLLMSVVRLPSLYSGCNRLGSWTIFAVEGRVLRRSRLYMDSKRSRPSTGEWTRSSVRLVVN
jgi:hypothetical protein